MPVKYDISNIYDLGTPCNFCGGSGMQHLGGRLGYRACQYCITGYKLRNCEFCGGDGCGQCIGTKHEFYNELASAAPSPTFATHDSRGYAGEAAPRPAQSITTRRR